MSVRELVEDYCMDEEVVLLGEDYDENFLGITYDNKAVYAEVRGDGVITVYPLDKDDDVMIFVQPSYNGAIIGKTNDGKAVYDYDLMLESLMTDEGWTYEESIEWIDYNIFGYGGNAPVVVMRLEEI